MIKRCSVKDCKDPYDAKGFCKMHYVRNKTYGTPVPIKQCFGCRKEFPWNKIAFMNRAYCDECENLIRKYWDWLPSRLQSIQSHGVTVIWFINTLINQDFSCAICGLQRKDRKKFRNLCIDHDHNCCPGAYGCEKCVRGLLCDFCNLLIGRYENNPRIFDSVSSYLKKEVMPNI